LLNAELADRRQGRSATATMGHLINKITPELTPCLTPDLTPELTPEITPNYVN